MFDFFDKIIGFVEQLWEFLVNMVNSLITAMETLLIVVQIPTILLPFLPSFIMVSVTIVISFSVIKFVIGR